MSGAQRSGDDARWTVPAGSGFSPTHEECHDVEDPGGWSHEEGTDVPNRGEHCHVSGWSLQLDIDGNWRAERGDEDNHTYGSSLAEAKASLRTLSLAEWS